MKSWLLVVIAFFTLLAGCSKSEQYLNNFENQDVEEGKIATKPAPKQLNKDTCILEYTQNHKGADLPSSETQVESDSDNLESSDPVRTAVDTLNNYAKNGCVDPADTGCEGYIASQDLLNAMDKQGVFFGGSLTPNNIECVEKRADKKIAIQRYYYLKSKGGVSFPNDMEILARICLVNGYNFDIISKEDLRKLVPPETSRVKGCDL